MFSCQRDSPTLKDLGLFRSVDIVVLVFDKHFEIKERFIVNQVKPYNHGFLRPFINNLPQNSNSLDIKIGLAMIDREEFTPSLKVVNQVPYYALTLNKELSDGAHEIVFEYEIEHKIDNISLGLENTYWLEILKGIKHDIGNLTITFINRTEDPIEDLAVLNQNQVILSSRRNIKPNTPIILRSDELSDFSTSLFLKFYF